MLQCSQSTTVMTPHTKGSNAVMFYDLEGYDDAFLRAVERAEETHSSPRAFSTPLQCLQVPSQSTSCNRKLGTAICREDLTPKKLDFSVVAKTEKCSSICHEQERSQKLTSWYERLVAHSNGQVPPLDSLEALGELSQEKALLVISHFPKGGWYKAVSVKDLKRFKYMGLCEVDGWMCHFAGNKVQKASLQLTLFCFFFHFIFQVSKTRVAPLLCLKVVSGLTYWSETAAASHIDWAVGDTGPAAFYGTWCTERLLPVDTFAEEFHIGRGTVQRVIEIESAIPDAWDQIIRGSTSMPHHQGWWGYFDENGLAILVKSVLTIHHCRGPGHFVAAQMGYDSLCIRCLGHMIETPIHCFLACLSSHLVWRAVALLLSRAEMCSPFGLSPGEEPWKQFVIHGLSRCVPSSGCMDAAGPWRPSVRYIFNMQSRLCTQHLSPFMYSIFRVWLTMRKGLIRHVPSCREEIERQPLIWNDYVRDEHGRQLGERTHIDWARWASGPASSFAVWAESSYADTEIMAMDFGIRRGISARMLELDAAIPDDWEQVLTGRRDVPLHVGWCELWMQTNWSKQEGNHVVFHGEIDAEGFLSLKGPYFEQTSSPLQRVFGEGGVLRVNFADFKKNAEIVKGVYRRISREGVWIGLRRYLFFAFKDPKGKKKQSGFAEDMSGVPKCFFVCTESFARWDFSNPNFHQYQSVREAQQFLMHIGTVPTNAKKFARLQLCLSQTLPILDLNSPDIKLEIIEDIFCRDKCGEIVCDANGEELIHTDGTGFISSDLAARCPPSVCKGNGRAASNDREPPLLLQVRVFYKGLVAKGTLLVNLKLPPSSIQVRKSMVKVTSDRTLRGPCYNSLEVCATSRRPGKAKLSPYIALLLTYGGVPEAAILRLVERELSDITTKLKNRAAALTSDHFDSALRMLYANVPMEEPYLKKTLLDLTRSQLQELSTGRVTIPDTYNLMGCADPTGRLERNQVAIVLESGPLHCPKVLVYKSPGLHVGDVKEFEATWHTDFNDIVGQGKYVIFFSVKGPRSVVDEIANSDLDGDQYWCCAYSEIVRYFKSSEVWQNPAAMKKKSSAKAVTQLEDFDNLHFEAYLKARFKPSQTMGMAANSWHAHMDKYLMLDEHDHRREGLWCKIQNLVNTYYDAVDAEKTGKQVSVRDDDKAREWPHYTEKQHEAENKWIKQETTYQSTTILGRIYNLVKGECCTRDFILELDKKIAEDTFIDKRFRYPGYEAYHAKWEAHYKEYRARILQLLYNKDIESRNLEIEALFQKYRMELYKSDTLFDSPEPIEEVYKQASAIYVIVYGQAQRKLEAITEDKVHENFKLVLQFAWKVAGFALLRLFSRTMTGKRKEPLLVEEEVFRNLKLVRRDK
ncbi:hypothetical protein L7F22_009810 [Adiantum nelumboides]|nr:hypothetical protein [Adiantum nelumboides]